MIFRWSDPLPRFVWAPAAALLLLWLVAYLPLALRRVYGGSWMMTLLKVAGLAVLYIAVFVLLGVPLVLASALASI